MRVPPKRLLHLECEAVHAAPHVGPANRQPNPRTGWERDHRRSSISRTSRRVAALTPASTRRRWPLASSISIRSANGAGGAVTVERGVTTKGTRLGAGEVCDAVPYRLRQVNTMLVFTLYWRATTDTEAPGAAAAATISRLSASGQDLCRRLGPAFVSIIEFVDTSHTTNIIMQASIGAHRLHRKAALTGGIPKALAQS